MLKRYRNDRLSFILKQYGCGVIIDELKALLLLDLLCEGSTLRLPRTL